jgi:formylglycine-generating enzyme required for sulfatase activity
VSGPAPLPPFTAGQLFELRLGDGLVLPFRFIPATGAEGFRMGSRDGPDDWTQETEQPVHRVCLREYWLGETPVTQAQFARWTQDHDAKHRNEFPGHPDHPAEKLDWRQAVRYCAWLTKEFGEQFPANVRLACLPTEAEWEYACRAGTETDYHTGDGEAALAEAGRYSQGYDAGTRPVRLGAKNAWSLYDLHGHVWQCCHDVWEKTAYRQRVDGAADASEAVRESDHTSNESWAALLKDDRDRVLRGGSWFGTAWGCRSASRFGWRPDDRYWSLGFRVCLVRGPASPPEAPRAPGVGGQGTRPETDGAGGAGADAGDAWARATLPRAAGRKK